MRAARPLPTTPCTRYLCVQEYWEQRSAFVALCQPQFSLAAVGVKRSAEECAAQRDAVLQRVAQRRRGLQFSPGHQSALDRIIAEFCTFLAGYNSPGTDTVATCTPIEVLIFLEEYYLPQHSGRNNGGVMPGTFDKAIGLLARAFEMQGRSGPWLAQRGLAPLGNPCKSDEIEAQQQCYAKEAADDGVAEYSATPLRIEDYRRLMHGLYGEVTAQLGLYLRGQLARSQFWLAARDAAMFSSLWASARRGQDILRQHWQGIATAEWARAADTFCACYDADVTKIGPAVPTLFSTPRRTKTEAGSRAQSWEYRARPPTRVRECAVDNLFTLYSVSRLLRCHHFEQGYVFVGTTSKSAGAITSSAIANRLASALTKHGISAPGDTRQYTVHSFRRGRLQYERRRGKSYDQLMHLAGISDVKTLKRYLDEGRHM